MLLVLGVECHRARRLALVESLLEAAKHLILYLSLLVATGLRLFLHARDATLDGLKVFQLQFVVDDFLVAHRVYRAVDMHHVRSSKQRSTWIMASVSRMFAKNLLPRPSPFDAPLTRPAMSTISTVAGTMRCGLTIAASLFKRSSGTLITPTLGSIVQKESLPTAPWRSTSS